MPPISEFSFFPAAKGINADFAKDGVQMNTPITTEVFPAVATAITLRPEWLRPADAVKLYGIGRSSLYSLIGEGRIKSVCLRRRGSTRGMRLISADSLSSYLESLAAATAVADR